MKFDINRICSDILQASKEGEIQGFSWFADHFANLEDLATLGFTVNPLLDQLKQVYYAFQLEQDVPTELYGKEIIGRRDLSKRLTFNYKSFCAKEEDEWDLIGEVFELGHTIEEPDNYEGSRAMREVVVKLIESDTDYDTVVKALFELYTDAGCAHDYDCCGCVSEHVYEVNKIDNVFIVKSSLSRNI